MDEPKKDEPVEKAAAPADQPAPSDKPAAPSEKAAPPPSNAPPVAGALVPTTDDGGGIDMKLVGLCVLLWAVAVGIFFSGWDDTKKDYYWGNIRQALEQPTGGYTDWESVDALAAMGETVLPSCEHELRSQPDPLFKIVVLRVLEKVPGAKSRALMATTASNDPNAIVRANALLFLRERAKKAQDEKSLLPDVAKERLANDRENGVKDVAAIVLAENGDKSGDVESMLVNALRLPLLRKDAWEALKAAHPTVPAVDATKDEDALKQVMAVETWCDSNGIAIVGSRLVAEPPKQEKK